MVAVGPVVGAVGEWFMVKDLGGVAVKAVKVGSVRAKTVFLRIVGEDSRRMAKCGGGLGVGAAWRSPVWGDTVGGSWVVGRCGRRH